MTTLLIVPIDDTQKLTTVSRMSSADIILGAALVERGAFGHFVKFDIDVDGVPGGKMAFMLNESTGINTRAQRALHSLTGMHMVITGTAVFADLETDVVWALALSI